MGIFEGATCKQEIAGLMERGYEAHHPGTLNNHILNGCLVKQPFFYVMIWSHPIETTTKNWLFGVPGVYEFVLGMVLLDPQTTSDLRFRWILRV